MVGFSSETSFDAVPKQRFARARRPSTFGKDGRSSQGHATLSDTALALRPTGKRYRYSRAAFPSFLPPFLPSYPFLPPFLLRDFSSFCALLLLLFLSPAVLWSLLVLL